MCGCTAINGTVKTFLLKYRGNKTMDTGATITCSVCATLGSTITVDYGNCANILFGEVTTTTESADTTETSGAEKIQIGVYGHATRLSVAILYGVYVGLVRGF